MALTPEDVINKRFQPTKFREGYDQDEVDDFLDEIVLELRTLNQEIADLTQQLEAAGSTPESSRTAAAVEAPAAEPTEASVDSASAPAVADDPEPTAAQGEATTDSAQSAAGVLAMAQKLHDEYVANGRAEHDRLVTEGQNQADQLVSDAQRSKEEVLAGLEQERGVLEQKVNDLKSFESSYRERLKSFIAGHLQEIDAAPPVMPEADQS